MRTDLPTTECVRILSLEDDPADADLLERALQKEWPQARIDRADNRESFVAALAGGNFDLILSDYTIPGFNGLEALALARTQKPGTPYVFFSGTIGEDRAVEALKQGASDYVLKDRPGRLVPAVRRALDENRQRKAPPPPRPASHSWTAGIATMAGVVVHQFNNALTPLFLVLPLIRERVIDPQVQRWIGLAEASMDKCSEIIRRLQVFARDQKGDFLDLRPRLSPSAPSAESPARPAWRGPAIMSLKAQPGQTDRREAVGEGGAILVIDDEECLLQMVKALLEAGGYQVLAAASGPEGIAAYREQKQEIKGVLTDASMPVMQGGDVVRELRAIDPTVGIVVMSGLGEVPGLSEEPGRLVFLRKPMTKQELFSAIEKVSAVSAV